ncbi:hypothetical protein JW905_06455 [bacterium]|nr:hypothetical protein [candidate division CSSED10-310 bacterium]
MSSEQAAETVFQQVLELTRRYSFTIGPDVLVALFGIEEAATAHVYDAGNATIEVFVTEAGAVPPGFRHVCLEVPDRERTLARARAAGLEIRRFRRGNSDVVFMVDTDHNLYELKECPRPA